MGLPLKSTGLKLKKLPLDGDFRRERIYIKITTQMRRANGQISNMKIEDASRYGIRATTDNPPDVGDEVYFSIGGMGEFAGVVRWARQNYFGVYTLDTIDINALRSK